MRVTTSAAPLARLVGARRAVPVTASVAGALPGTARRAPTATRGALALGRRALLAALLLLGCTGCAQVPAGYSSGTRHLLTMSMTMRGPIDPNAYYLFVIDTSTTSVDGPQVIAPNTLFLGNGRATGSYTHYVEYHLGRFELYRDQPEQQGVTPPLRTDLGQPFRYDSTSFANTLSCSLDLSQLKTLSTDPDLTQVKLNFITVNELVLPGQTPPVPRQSDGLGPDGTNYLLARLQTGNHFDNSNAIETTGESVFGQAFDPAYDLADFRVDVTQGN